MSDIDTFDVMCYKEEITELKKENDKLKKKNEELCEIIRQNEYWDEFYAENGAVINDAI